MGIKGLSANVIKRVWRDCSLSSLPRGARIGVDGAGWLHKAAQSMRLTSVWKSPARMGIVLSL